MSKSAPEQPALQETTIRTPESIPPQSLFGMFFLSGFSALIYQIIWQRALFTIYGTNSESIAVVVAVFMLGLGLGSLAGGELSRRQLANPIKLFALAEVGIGVFGLISLPLFGWLGSITSGVGITTAGFLAFVVLLFPTLLMGATLPLLVGHLVKLDPNVGVVVGDLYYVNTLGSAASCVCAALFLFFFLGMNGAVILAGTINLGVAGFAFFQWSR
jgi:spermidine synthase